jgi:PAS domain S-box-containing protein
MGKAIVIVVTDNQVMGEDIVKNLSSMGYELPYLVTDGNEAIIKAEELKPDLVIIDTDLQGSTDIVDAAIYIQRDLRIPVIFIIDNTEGKTFERVRGTNPYGYLVRPIVRDELYTVVETAIHRYKDESRLRERRNLYRMMINNANEAIMVIQDGDFRFINPKAVELFGFSVEDDDHSLKDYIPKSFTEFIHPDDRNMVLERHLKRLTGEEFEHVYPFRIVDRYGKIKWLEINATVFDWEGKPATLNFLKDVTDRIRAEETLRQRNIELEMLNRVGNTLISTLNLNQLLIRVLDEVCNVIGVIASSVWMIDIKTKELVCIESVGPGNDIVRGWRLKWGEGIAGWVAQHRESIIVNDTKTDERHFKGLDKLTGINISSIISIPLYIKRDVKGVLQAMDSEVNRFNETHLKLLEPIAASSVIAIENVTLFENAKREILERKLAEERLRESEEIYRSIFERNHSIILIIDPDTGSIADANPAACDFYGYSRNRMKRMNISEINILTHQQMQREMARSKMGEKTSFNYKHRLKSGDIRDVEAHISDITIGNKKFLYSIIYDITEKKNLENEILRSLIRLLSKKEMEIMQHISEGLGRKEISKKMNIAVATYDKHLMNIKRKLKIKKKSELIKLTIDLRDYLL